MSAAADKPEPARRPVANSNANSAANPTPNFDRLAHAYRWMEWASFGPLLGQCRCAWLGAMQSARHALVIGDGDGRFTARLLAANRTVRVDAIDASPAMLHALAHRAASNAARLRTFCLDARYFDAQEWRAQQVATPAEELAAAYDLIVTHFFLDCLTTPEVGALAGQIAAAVAPGALWVVSDFAVPRGWFGRLVAKPVVAFLYAAFGWLTGLRVRCLPDHTGALHGAGFKRVGTKPLLGGLLVSELWRFGDSI